MLYFVKDVLVDCRALWWILRCQPDPEIVVVWEVACCVADFYEAMRARVGKLSAEISFRFMFYEVFGLGDELLAIAIKCVLLACG